MKWVYVLKCIDDYYYVGETSRLYRRFWEHLGGNGGLNTSIHKPERIVAIYKVSTICKFFEYNHIIKNEICNIYFNRQQMLINDFDENEEYESLSAENSIVECFMIHSDNWEKIRGGKYVRFDIKYTFPKNEESKSLPICKCGLPCDIKKDEKDDSLYFRCAKKNMWGKMKETFDILEEPCNFYMKYNENDYIYNYNEIKYKIRHLVDESKWLNQLVGRQYEYCAGGCGKKYDENRTIRYLGTAINLCYDCFINKNEELSQKYTIFMPRGVCLIKL